MSDGIEFYLNDLEIDLNQAAMISEHLNQRRAVENSVSPEDVQNLANFARYYPGVSPELAAGFSVSGAAWDDPAWSDVVIKDAVEQDKSLWQTFWQGARATTRTAFLGMEGFFEEYSSRPLRSAYRVFSEGEDWDDAWRAAGQSTMSMAAAQLAQGEPVNVGSGWAPGSTLAHEAPGFGAELQQNIDEGMEPDVARGAAQQSWYAEHGTPLSYESQQWRESTLVKKTREGITSYTPFSPGRASAIHITTPGTNAHKWLSGSIDAGFQVAADPMNLLAAPIGAAFKARHLIGGADEAVGVVRSWRPWVNGHTAESFLSSRRGTRLVNYLTENKSYHDLHELLEPLGSKVVADIARTNNPAHVRDLLRPHLGVALTDASQFVPKRVGSWAGANIGQPLGAKLQDGAFGLTSTFNPDSGLSRIGRRLSATSRGHILNPMNRDEVVRVAKNWMDTAGIDKAAQDPILGRLATGGQSYRTVASEYRNMAELTGQRFRDLGYDSQDVRYMMETMFDDQVMSRAYMHDQAGNRLDDGLEMLKVQGPDGSEIELYRHGAHLDSEMADQMLVLPEVREIRIATAKTRALRNKFRKARKQGSLQGKVWDPDQDLMLGTGPIASVLERGMSAWRNTALIRGGWPIRIIMDEAGRWQASGLTDRNPITSFYYMTMKGGKKDLTDITGAPLLDSLTPKALGAGGWATDRELKHVMGTRFDASRASWSMEETRRLVRQADEETGVEALYEWTTAGKRGIAREYHQLGSSQLARRVALPEQDDIGAIDAAMEYFMRDPDGIAIIDDIVSRATKDNPLAYLKDEAVLRRKLQSIDARIEMMSGGDIRYYDETAAVWKNSFGHPVDADDIARNGLEGAEDLRYITVQNGNQDLRRFLATGTDRDGVVRMSEEMSAEDFRNLEDWLPNQFGDHIPPAKVKVPNPNLTARVDGWTRKFVDGAFKGLGEVPTMKLLREGFAAERYIDHAAQFYAIADDLARVKLNRWADSLDPAMMRRWRKTRDKAMRERRGRMKTRTKGDELDPFTFEEIDEIVKAKALKDTKDLFYDLQKKGNWADATRLIFPFGEAWFEVLTTWSRLLGGPKGAGQVRDVGRIAKNWRRIETTYQTANENLTGSGFFTEDEFGNETFNFPGFGMLSGLPVQTKAQLDQLMFMQLPSGNKEWYQNLRGVVMPGTSPLVQIGAAAVDVFISEESFVDEMFDTVMYGEFEQNEGRSAVDKFMTPLLPTWGKRLLALAYEPERRKEYADELLELYSIALHSNPDAQHLTPEGSMKLMEELRPAATTLAWARLFDSAILPAQTQYDPGIIVEMAGHEKFISLGAIARDLAVAREVYGDETAATKYIIERYGLDPLNLTGKTTRVLGRPTSEDAWKRMKAMPEDLRTAFPTMLMAIIGEASHEDFYGDAWRDQIDEGAREYKEDADFGLRLLSQQQGNRSHRALIEVYDAELEKIKVATSPGSDSRSVATQNLKEWKDDQERSIGMQYFNWEPGAGAWGGTGRPELNVLMEELLGGGTPGTERNRLLHEYSPETARYFEYMAALWTTAESESSSRGFDQEWWRVSETNPDTVAGQDKAQLRDWVISSSNAYIGQMEEGPARDGARWVSDELIGRLVEGYSFDDVLFIEPEPPPAIPENEIISYLRSEDIGASP